MDISLLVSKLSKEELISLKKLVDSQLKLKLSENQIRISHLDISRRAYNILRSHNISTLEELANMTIDEFADMKNVGRGTVDEMTEILELNGLNWNVSNVNKS